VIDVGGEPGAGTPGGPNPQAELRAIVDLALLLCHLPGETKFNLAGHRSGPASSYSKATFWLNSLRSRARSACAGQMAAL